MVPVQITILGSGDAFSSGGRYMTSFHIRSGDFSLLLDCGATALTAMKQLDIPSESIDTIVITHFHGDHFAGLPFLILDMARAGRKQPLTIISPPGGQAKLKAAMALFYPGSARLLQSVSVHYLEFRNAALLKSGPLTVLALPVIHTRETLPHGVRLTLNGITVAYSGDTEWTDHLVTLARDADLFICECTFFDTEKKGHLSYKALQQHRQELQCRRLLLTHCDTEMLQHRDEVTEAIAEDKMVLELTGTG